MNQQVNDNHPNPIDVMVGRNLANRRTMARFTQKQFGVMCEGRLSYQQISKYELGQTQIGAARLVEFARLLNCSVVDLFAGIEGLLPARDISRHEAEAISEFLAMPKEVQAATRLLMRCVVKETAEKLSMGRIEDA